MMLAATIRDAARVLRGTVPAGLRRGIHVRPGYRGVKPFRVPTPINWEHGDPLVHDPVIRKFTRCMMWDGKLELAEKIINKTMGLIKLQVRKEDSMEDTLRPVDVIHEAINNCKPVVETKAIKLGGSRYQVPHPVKESRQQFLAIKWIIHSARNKVGKFELLLMREFIAAYKHEGAAVEKKTALHKLAEASRSYAHYR